MILVYIYIYMCVCVCVCMCVCVCVYVWLYLCVSVCLCVSVIQNLQDPPAFLEYAISIDWFFYIKIFSIIFCPVDSSLVILATLNV